MKFEIININKGINDIMRQIGYQPSYYQDEEEFSMIRKLTGNDYPRFHLYIKEVLRQSSGQMEGKSYTFSLHLDQKKPSYKGARKHSGEYNGPMVEKETERIKSFLN